MTHSGVWGNMWDVYRVLPLQWWSSSPASRGVKVRQINRPSRPEEEKQKCPVSAMSRSFWYECWCLGVEDSRQGSTVRWPAVCQRGGACTRSLPAVRAWRSVQFTSRTLGQCSKADRRNGKMSALLGIPWNVPQRCTHCLNPCKNPLWAALII